MKHEWGEDRVGVTLLEFRLLGAPGPFRACRNCGVSDVMADYMGWFECAAVSADKAEVTP